MNNQTKTAFTLVELIVVITILAILGTIAFLAFQGYSASARDSKRISDMNTIKTSLELFGLNSGKFPDPVNPVFITYSSGSINDLNLRQQGIFGQQNITNVSSAGKLDRLPKDPLTEIEYTYSTTLNKKEFELGTILENDEVTFSSINFANAASKKVVSAFIKGNYNGKILKTSSGTTSYIFAVPSIINSDATLTDINELISPINKIAYNGFANLPASYDGPTFEVNGAPDSSFVNPNEILVFEGPNYSDLINPEDSSARIDLLQNIKDAYSGTDLVSEGGIKEIVESDPSNPTTTEENLAGSLVNQELDGDVEIVPINGSGTIVDGGEDEGGETLVCNDMTEDDVLVLNELEVYNYTKEQWCLVTQLNLSSWGLTSLPNQIGYLTNLTELNLNDNQLSTLPESIKNLTKLQTLDLNRNSGLGDLSNSFVYTDTNLIKEYNIPTIGQKMTIGGNGTNIVINIESFTRTYTCSNIDQNVADILNTAFTLNYSKEKRCNIDNLDLSNKSLETIPPEIGNLTHLISLNLNGNSYLSTLPNSIGNLTNLTNLDLTWNNFSTLPNSILNLTNLSLLNLSRNKLTTLPPEIGNLIHLTNFNIKGNEFITFPNSILNLTNLTSLDISDNQFLTLLPLEIGNLTNLTNLNLANNGFTTFPNSILNLTNLTSLGIGGPFTSVPPEIGNLTNLTSLSIDNGPGPEFLISLPSEICNLIHLTNFSLYMQFGLGNLSDTYSVGDIKTRTQSNITPDGKTMTIEVGSSNITISVY